MESGPFNLKEIGDNFSVDIEKPLKPVMDQWIKAGLLEKSGEVYSPTVAGQFWYVTMAQLATEALTMAIAKKRFFQSGSDYAKRIFTQPSRSVVKNH